MARRHKFLVAALVAIVAAVLGWMMVGPNVTDKPRANAQGGLETIQVTRRDIAVGVQMPGELGYGPATPIPIRATGTVTWLPGAGAVARSGDELLRVDDRPVILMYGHTPAFRAMHAAASIRDDEGSTSLAETDKPSASSALPAGDPATTAADSDTTGPDVEQFERGLRALGYNGFTVDDRYTNATAAAVVRWQESLGIPGTGQVELGDIVFLPGPVRLHPDVNQLGRTVSETAVEAQRTQPIVTVTGAADQLDWARNGARVTVTLPDASQRVGHVESIASMAAAEGGQQVVTVSLERPADAGLGAVTVTHISASRDNVLTVPVTALVALSEGGYGLQLRDGGYVPVNVGLHGEGVVEVSGSAVSAGTKVLVPR